MHGRASRPWHPAVASRGGEPSPVLADRPGAPAAAQRRASFFEALTEVMPLWDTQQQAEMLDALDQLGLLDAFLDYLPTHPDGGS